MKQDKDVYTFFDEFGNEPKKDTYWLYILSNVNFQGPLYLGETTDLPGRLQEHWAGERRDFAHYHRLDRLVYFETWNCSEKFAARLRRVRNWPRDMRLLLIESLNPNWEDLSPNVYESLELPFNRPMPLPAVRMNKANEDCGPELAA